MRLPLAALLLALSVAACGKSTSTGSCTVTATSGSTTYKLCGEYDEQSSDAVESAKSACATTASGGTASWAESKCDTASVTGTCALDQSGVKSTQYYYSPYDSTTGKALCDSAKGTFTAK